MSSAGGRTHNQDQARAQLLNPNHSLWGVRAVAAVADGMGGHSDGQRASRLTMDTVFEVLSASSREASEFSVAWLSRSLTEVAARTVKLANSRVHSPNLADTAQRSMGSTLTFAAVREQEAILGHVGDSRAYLAEGAALHLITQDHTFTAEAVARGEMTPEEAAQSPFAGHLTRAVGVRAEVDPQTMALPFRPGMTLLLCSDGLTGVLGDDEIAAVLHDTRGAGQVARRLVELAEQRDTQDNVSVACLDWRA